VNRSRNGRREQSRFGADKRPGRAKQRAFCIAVAPEDEDLAELRELLRTAGADAVGQEIQHREAPHPNTYLGRGKLEELRPRLVEADANLVACDDELTPRQ
jgi:GTPase